MLQLNFTNNFGTTPGQIARGGSPHDVYLGFNITPQVLTLTNAPRRLP